ncbi:branched-chain amino acid ABC transporter permease [Halosegnis rubeus]|uniref:Branched-chain amino acid ABC transporter permease n=1 Tax=Halosegnis rubeus TaxID=2212850 RepID=A0A5N5UB21_9EURY|nr:branched-chain amino acid ABC transporter permease [Halosegnis rubeus]KAB7515815.1 branched-chain amino acid ABC transporter permease [Halosegnis rubeus]KAB7519901.1 branched-chain amino acid ABC transporter permease [Halosegnis rubeus]
MSPRVPRDELRVLGLTALAVLAFPYLFAEAPVVSDVLNGYAGLATPILIWGIFVMGYDLLHGYTGLLSFGHAAFWGAGGMTVGALIHHAEFSFPLVAVALAVVVGILLAALIGYLSLRRGGIYFAILTLAFGQMIYYTMLGPAGQLTNGEDGLILDASSLFGVIPLDAGLPVLTPLGIIPSWLYAVTGVLTLVSVAVAYRILQSPYGLVFKAIRENEQRASFVGLNVWRYKLAAFVASGAFAGLAGGLHALQAGNASASPFYWIVSGDVVIMSILGGVGTLFGGFIGAGIYLYMDNVASSIGLIGDRWHLLLGVLFVVIVWLFPDGVWGGLRRLRSMVGSDDTTHTQTTDDGGND